MAEQTFYDQIGGAYPIARAMDILLDAIVENQKILDAASPQLKKWLTEDRETRLPGLKFHLTLWSCAGAGGPYQYPGDIREILRPAHEEFNISPEVFDEFISEITRLFKEDGADEAVTAETVKRFSSWKDAVTAGYKA